MDFTFLQDVSYWIILCTPGWPNCRFWSYGRTSWRRCQSKWTTLWSVQLCYWSRIKIQHDFQASDQLTCKKIKLVVNWTAVSRWGFCAKESNSTWLHNRFPVYVLRQVFTVRRLDLQQRLSCWVSLCLLSELSDCEGSEKCFRCCCETPLLLKDWCQSVGAVKLPVLSALFVLWGETFSMAGLFEYGR